MLRCVWQALNSLSINIYRDCPRGVGYPADAHSVGDSHPSCFPLTFLFIAAWRLSLYYNLQRSPTAKRLYSALWAENHAFSDTKLTINHLFVSQLTFWIDIVKQSFYTVEITNNLVKRWVFLVKSWVSGHYTRHNRITVYDPWPFISFSQNA